MANKANQNQDAFGDDRMKKDAGSETRGSRERSNSERTQDDGGSLTAAERRRMLRQDWVQEVLPKPPVIPGYHVCWLSTTNSTDPIFKRIQHGYEPVKFDEVPQFGKQYVVQEGDFEGCISCNEMLLFKVDMVTYQDLMMIFHHDIPNEHEESIYDRVRGERHQDSNGTELLQVEGDFEKLGRKVRTPTFTE